MTRFVDRISGITVAALPAEVLSGQFVLATAGRLDHDQQSRIGTLIVDNGDPSIAIETAEGTTRARVVQGASQSTLSASLEVAAHMDESSDQGATWWETASLCDPVVSRQEVGRLLDTSALEEAIAVRLPELRSVFFEPVTELRFDRQRVPVGRARRISRRASQTLASRSEDWLRVSAAGVTPRVIESLIRDEVVDVYENRVAARLIDQVRLHIGRSLRLMDDLDALVGHSLTGWWRLRERLARAWGHGAADDGLRERLQARREGLTELLTQIEGLRDGRLYAGVPRRAEVQQPIRLTNLLSDDPHYRAVGQVWEQWWRSRGQDSAASDRRRERQRQSAAFMQVARLYLLRAMAAVADDFEGDESNPLARGGWGTLELREDALEGVWYLRITPRLGEEVEVRIVALAAEVLVGSDQDASVGLRHLSHACATAPRAVVLYPGTNSDRAKLNPTSYALAFASPREGPSTTGWRIPVSPLDLTSQERVEQMVRWYLLGHAFAGYPATVSFPTSHRHMTTSWPWVRPAASPNQIVVIGVPGPGLLAAAIAEVEQAARKQEMRLAGAGRHDADVLRSTAADLADVVARMDGLVLCPVCSGRAAFEARARDTFEATCGGCRSRWGLRHDAASDDRLPYLTVDDPKVPIGADAQRWLGRDTLTLPCRSEAIDYGRGVINPFTGVCTEARTGSSSCSRLQCGGDGRVRFTSRP